MGDIVKISVAGMFGNGPKRGVEHLREFCQAAEAIGFASVSFPEHVVFFTEYESKYPYSEDGAAGWGPETGLFDPLFATMAGAAVTSTLRFVSGVVILPQRPALLTAREVLSLDHMTGGRFDFGVGTGWSWEEYAALGVPFEKRGRRMDEYLAAITSAWTDDLGDFSGEFVQFENAVMNPKPVTPGGPAILIGGSTPVAMRRAARHDGWYGWWAYFDIDEHIAELDVILGEHDRSTSDEDFDFRLGIPTGFDAYEEVATKAAKARSLGVDELVIAAPIATRNFEEQLRMYYEAAVG
ncbi:MAG: TIGR03619 family F420-dependent LLM class oxidoreductase [Acidimicrobiales bacterium]|jgi:probable F420-dependent oxidoreductase